MAAGEPAGLWYGAGADELGLRGEVDAELMEAVYTHLLDPRDSATASQLTWGEAAPLAAGGICSVGRSQRDGQRAPGYWVPAAQVLDGLAVLPLDGVLEQVGQPPAGGDPVFLVRG